MLKASGHIGLDDPGVSLPTQHFLLSHGSINPKDGQDSEDSQEPVDGQGSPDTSLF